MRNISVAMRLGSAISLVALAAAPSLALQTGGSVSTSNADYGNVDGTADKAAAGKLAAAIRSELAKQPPSASPEDLEGIIVFVVSQGVYSDASIDGALNAVSAGASDNLLKAIDNVRLALLKKKLKRGTAAIGNGGFGSGAGTGSGGGFTSPGVSTGGGGSSNYST